MPLDERERRILEEIERQFYEEDPKLVQTVRNTSPASVARRHLRRAVVGLVVGVGLMLATFMRFPLVAVVGFAVMVVSGWVVVTTMRRGSAGFDTVAGRSGAWLDGLRERWRRGR